MRKQSKKRQQHRTLAEPPRLRSPCAPQRGVCSPLPRPWGAVLYPLLPLALSTVSSSLTCSSGESKHLHRPQEARWNEKLQGAKPRVRASTQTRCSREEEMPACPSPKVKTELHADVKGQRFPLHPCHVQVTRQAFGASCLARVIHPTAAIALHLHIQKQTLRPSREGGCLGFPHPHSHSHQGQAGKTLTMCLWHGAHPGRALLPASPAAGWHPAATCSAAGGAGGRSDTQNGENKDLLLKLQEAKRKNAN